VQYTVHAVTRLRRSLLILYITLVLDFSELHSHTFVNLRWRCWGCMVQCFWLLQCYSQVTVVSQNLV